MQLILCRNMKIRSRAFHASGWWQIASIQVKEKTLAPDGRLPRTLADIWLGTTSCHYMGWKASPRAASDMASGRAFHPPIMAVSCPQPYVARGPGNFPSGGRNFYLTWLDAICLLPLSCERHWLWVFIHSVSKKPSLAIMQSTVLVFFHLNNYFLIWLHGVYFFRYPFAMKLWSKVHSLGIVNRLVLCLISKIWHLNCLSSRKSCRILLVGVIHYLWIKKCLMVIDLFRDIDLCLKESCIQLYWSIKMNFHNKI